MQSFNWEFTLHIWHRRPPNCCDMFAESFKWISIVSSESPVQSFNWIAERPSSVNSYLWNCFMMLTWCWKLRCLHLGLRWKALPNKIPDTCKLNSFHSLLAKYKNIKAYEIQFHCFDLLWFRSFLFSESEWDHKHSCKMYYTSWMLILCCQCS